MKIIICIACLYLATIFAQEQECKAPPNNNNPQECCALIKMVPEDIDKECIKAFGDMRKKQLELPGPKRGCCISNCVTEKLGVNPNGEGNLDRDGLRKYMQEQLGENSVAWMDILNTAVDKCYAMADAKMDEWNKVLAIPPAFDGDKSCHLISGEVLRCINNEMFLNCPDGIYNQSTECDAIMDFVDKCNYIPKIA